MQANNDNRLSTREHAQVSSVIRKIRTSQAMGSNAIVDAMGVEEFKRFIQTIMDDPGFFLLPYDWTLRGDALSVLADAVQENLVNHLARACVTSASLTSSSEYPIVDLYNLKFQDHVQGTWTSACPGDSQQISFFDYPDHLRQWPRKDSVVRHLARRAGVVKIEDDAFQMIWDSLIHLVVQILHHLYNTIIHTADPDPDTPDVCLLPPGHTMFTKSYFERRRNASNQLIHEVLLCVPGEVIVAVKQLRICENFYYDGNWLASSPDDVRREKDAAEALYAFPECDQTMTHDDDDSNFDTVFWTTDMEVDDEEFSLATDDEDGWD
jgi:hypothetical protein